MTYYCPHCAVEVQRRKAQNGEVFWACRNRVGCGWTWVGDEERPLATSAHDGERVPQILWQLKDELTGMLESLWPQRRGVVYRALLGQVAGVEDLLELGALRREWRERRIG